MVLSGSKRTTYMSSIVNQNSGGGPKKAGLPFQIGREASVSIAYKNTSQKLVFLQGPKAMLKQALMIAQYYLDKATAVKAIADALVVSTQAAKDADGSQSNIDAYDAAVAAQTTAGTNVTTEQGKVTTAQSNLSAYTAAV
ncbi:hypothetical protein OAS95_01940 [Pelagibacteraceae bacterium]|nr:hypothetical protein [Pelagibacteraceae bacterium]